MTPLVAEVDRGHAQRRERASRCRAVVTYAVGGVRNPNGHEAATRAEIARRVADLAGFAYTGEYDPQGCYARPPYFVPSDTLTIAAAASLRIDDPLDLFGGVVPAAYAATKTITHPLVDRNARAPAGWCAEFPRRVARSVLDGFSAFAREDALRAGATLLERGAVRVKLATGIAGIGQWVAPDAATLQEVIAAIGDDAIASAGVVVEQNLTDVCTHSVGQVRVAGVQATYCGTQRLTSNNHGVEVYGGSDLRVVRGDFDALLALDLPDDARLAITQARVYDEAAATCFTGFFASRRNYDVAQGRDAAGCPRSGVLEQSWRLGGATGAEIAALEAFRADDALRVVGAASREVYGASPPLPEAAVVLFRGVDPRVGALTKYALVQPHADAR